MIIHGLKHIAPGVSPAELPPKSGPASSVGSKVKAPITSTGRPVGSDSGELPKLVDGPAIHSQTWIGIIDPLSHMQVKKKTPLWREIDSIKKTPWS